MPNVTLPGGAAALDARVYRSTAQTIPGSILTKLSFDVERWDVGDFWNAAEPTKLVVPVDGLYLFGAELEWDASATGNRFADFYLNDETIIGELTSGWALNASGGPLQHGSTVWRCAAGDEVEVRVYQSSGGDLDTVAGTATEANHCDFYVSLVHWF
jgi:hypothetical protein